MLFRSDGTYQISARPLPTLRGLLFSALGLRWLGRFSDALLSPDYYPDWHGETERTVGSQSGCCLLLRGPLLKQLGGFDERFFFYYEEVDLCARVWQSGASIRFFPGAVVTHLGGETAGRSSDLFPARSALEMCRSRYRYFFKHFGERGARWVRQVALLHSGARWFGHKVKNTVRPNDFSKRRIQTNQVLLRWNWELDPMRFVKTGEEPDLGYAPLGQTAAAVKSGA